MERLLSEMNAVHTFATYVLKINLDIVHQTTTTFPSVDFVLLKLHVLSKISVI